MMIILKEKNYRDPHLLAMARGRQCLLRLPGRCNYNPETTVCCHGNGLITGKGFGLKGNDMISVWGCYECHRWFDQVYAPIQEKLDAFWPAYRDQLEAWNSIVITHETCFQGKRKDYESAKNAIAEWRQWVARNLWRFDPGDWQLRWIKEGITA